MRTAFHIGSRNRTACAAFTMIELVVAVMLVAVMMFVAVPDSWPIKRVRWPRLSR